MLTAALVVLVMLCFDLSGIAMMGSAAFLLVYAAVNAGHLLVLKQTGANATIVWLSLITCLAMFAILGVYTYQQQPAAIAALVLIAAASFAVEWVGPDARSRARPDRAESVPLNLPMVVSLLRHQDEQGNAAHWREGGAVVENRSVANPIP